MTVLLLSDLHGNIDALHAIDAQVLQRKAFDQIWVLGDLVDYGPAPSEVIAWVRARASHVVRGNHDHAMGTGEDCRSSPLYRELAVATREYFRPRLASEDLAFLAGLPLRASATGDAAAGAPALLAHATPRDPLFEYVPGDAPDAVWRAGLAGIQAPSFVYVGHSHDQFTRTIDGITLTNPGSAGLPKDGNPRAACAVLEDGLVRLIRVPYDVERAVSRVRSLDLAARDRDRLVHLLEHASLA